MTGSELKEIRKNLGISSSYEMAKHLGVPQSTYIRWELGGDKEIPKAKHVRMIEEFVASRKKQAVGTNALFIGEINNDVDEDGNTKFTEISPGRYRMKIDLVPVYARAGYLSSYGDIEYMNELPKHEITVTRYHKGKYLAFEVAGDSMDDGSINSIPDRSIITGREIRQDLWRPKLHTHNHDYFVFVHKTEGVLVKMIKHQEVETGDIILSSLNPNKQLYPDQMINLKDVSQILNVVKIEREL